MSHLTIEPTVGSRVDVDFEERESWVTGKTKRKVKISLGDVDSRNDSSVCVDGETFEKIIEWYENQ